MNGQNIILSLGGKSYYRGTNKYWPPFKHRIERWNRDISDFDRLCGGAEGNYLCDFPYLQIRRPRFEILYKDNLCAIMIVLFSLIFPILYLILLLLSSLISFILLFHFPFEARVHISVQAPIRNMEK